MSWQGCATTEAALAFAASQRRGDATCACGAIHVGDVCDSGTDRGGIWSRPGWLAALEDLAQIQRKAMRDEAIEDHLSAVLGPEDNPYRRQGEDHGL